MKGATTFPDVSWFRALGERMTTERERFQRLGYAETRFVIRILGEGNGSAERQIGLAFDGYRLADVEEVRDAEAYDPDFILCATASVWRRMLDEIAREGRPALRHTLNSLVLVGDDMWLESTDQLREDRFYRFNQTLQEFFNLSAASSADRPRG